MYSYLTFTNKTTKSGRNTEGTQELKIHIAGDSTGKHCAS